MTHLHTENVIHRDLAARNILLGRDLEAVVADFGMSRMASSEDNVMQTKSEVGPLKWMSPENIADRLYSKKSDVFSFGVTLWEIFARRDPWDNKDALSVAFAVKDGETLKPINCPPKIAEIMLSCFAFKPINRPNFDHLFDLFEKLEKEN